MSLIDFVKEHWGLKYEDLTDEEKKVLMTWENSLEKSRPSIEGIKSFISNLKKSVELELIKEPEFRFFIFPNRRHIFLKARLENLIYLENILFVSDKMKEYIEEYIKSLKK